MRKSILATTVAAFCAMPAMADRVIEINDGWECRQARSNNSYTATVPGCVHTALIDNGIIGYPYYRLNERNVQWIDKEDWEYSTKVWVDRPLLGHDRIILECDGLDTNNEYFTSYIFDE